MSESRPQEMTTVQPTIGAILRKRREELGWNDQNIADHLRIRLSLLHALEQGDYQALPGQAYAIGFLRNYAALLGLDVEKLVSAFKYELSAASQNNDVKPQELDFPQAVGERSLPKWLLITIGLAFVLVAYVGWYHFSSHDDDGAKMTNSSLLADNDNNNSDSASSSLSPSDEADAGSADNNVPSSSDIEADTGNEENAAPPETTVSEDISSGQNVPAQNGAVPNNPPSNNPLPNNAPSYQSVPNASAQNDNVQSSNIPPSLALPKEAQQQKSPFVAPQAVPAATLKADELPAHVVELHVTQDSWIKISDHSGKVLEARVFKAGETWRGDGNAAPYTVTAGNAAGVVMKAGTVTTPPLGKAGEVRRNISISAENIANGNFGRTDQAPNGAAPSVKTDNALLSRPKILDQNAQTH